MFTPVNNNKNRSNNKNNNKNNKQANTRFNFISEELKAKEEKSKSDKPKENKPKEEKPKENKPKEQKPKSDKPKNDRFNIEKLMVEEEIQRNDQRNEQRNELRNNYSQNIPIIQSSVPIAIHNPEPNMLPIIKENDFPDLKSISQNKVTKNTNSNTNSYKKAINYENIPDECEENKKPIVPTGWVYIVKNKTGKSDIIYGPKTEVQKRKEYLSTNLNYQMCLSISNMEEKWNRYEQLYDSFHGENAFRERYGYVPTYDTDDDDYDYDYNETDPSDDDYDDYESE
jgi:hypothetical protein